MRESVWINGKLRFDVGVRGRVVEFTFTNKQLGSGDFDSWVKQFAKALKEISR